jgi:5'-nucleotidase/UDP-sugar diphosphatase
VRFDGTLFVGEVTGAQLQKIMSRANQGPDTPFAAREGENLIAAGPAMIDPGKHYRLVTTDWGARNAKDYFGDAAPAFVERPELKLKAAVIGALAVAK